MQPKIVHHKNTEPSKTTESSANQVDTVTASVAASVAVAATAPFLKVFNMSAIMPLPQIVKHFDVN